MRLINLILITFIFNITNAMAVEYLDFQYRAQFNKNWVKLNENEYESVKLLLQILQESKTGRKIILMAKKKANREGKTLLDVIIPGDGSLTDTTLIRRFSPSSPDHVIYESKSVVYISRYHNLKDALLDLAHELTHFVYREPFNPYKSDFSFREFMVSTIEGAGGEVDAYLIECKVMQELIGKRHVQKSDCMRVRNKDGRFSKKLGVKEFYKVGNYAQRYWSNFKNFGIDKKSLPWLSEEQAHFISSAYALPYPVAAYEEYVNIMAKVCENDSKRLSLMSSSARRGPASKALGVSTFRKSFKSRCSKINF